MKPWYFWSPLILQKVIWIPTNIVLRFFGQLKVEGLENLKGIEGSAIFACNHASESDVFFVPATLPFFSRFSPIFYTSRGEKNAYKDSGWRKYFYGGALFKAWGAYPVYVGLHDYAKAIPHHIDIIKAGGSLVIFPEGGTTPDGDIRPAKGGIGYMAYMTGASIVPVYIGGTFRIRLADLLARKARLSISFGAPLQVAGAANTSFSGDDFKTYANFVMDKVRAMKQSA